jgi:hypothetical protein
MNFKFYNYKYIYYIIMLVLIVIIIINIAPIIGTTHIIPITGCYIICGLPVNLRI